MKSNAVGMLLLVFVSIANSQLKFQNFVSSGPVDVSSEGFHLHGSVGSALLCNQQLAGDFRLKLEYANYSHTSHGGGYQASVQLFVASQPQDMDRIAQARTKIEGDHAILSLRTHESIDYSWFSFSNQSVSFSQSTSPRMSNGQLQLVRKGRQYIWVVLETDSPLKVM